MQPSSGDNAPPVERLAGKGSQGSLMAELFRTVFGLGVRHLPWSGGRAPGFTCWFGHGSECPLRCGFGSRRCQAFHAQCLSQLAEARSPQVFHCANTLAFVACSVWQGDTLVGVLQSGVFLRSTARDELRRLCQAKATIPMVEGTCERCLAHLLGLLAISDSVTELSLSANDSRPHAREVETAMRRLGRDDLYGVCLVGLAQEAGLSPSRLSHLMCDYTGQPFHDHLRQARLKLARRLLREPRWSVADVAERCGYDTASAFANFFTRHEGCPPSVYRRQVRSTLLTGDDTVDQFGF